MLLDYSCRFSLTTFEEAFDKARIISLNIPLFTTVYHQSASAKFYILEKICDLIVSDFCVPILKKEKYQPECYVEIWGNELQNELFDYLTDVIYLEPIKTPNIDDMVKSLILGGKLKERFLKKTNLSFRSFDFAEFQEQAMHLMSCKIKDYLRQQIRMHISFCNTTYMDELQAVKKLLAVLNSVELDFKGDTL